MFPYGGVSVGKSICQSEPCRTTERIEIPFGTDTFGNPTEQSRLSSRIRWGHRQVNCFGHFLSVLVLQDGLGLGSEYWVRYVP